MASSIYRFIFRHSLRQQLLLLLLTALSFPFLYLSLELPKTIINEAIGGTEFPVELFGLELQQVPYLFALCAVFLALVFVNGGFKLYINIYKGRMGERMLRRLRYELYARVLRFPLPHFRKVSQGEIIPMITAEVEPLGGFIGDALAQPAFQGGTLLTILAFMFVQDPILGTAAIALYPLQAYLIPKMQRKVNQLGKRRVREVRRLADRIGETISGIHEVHANGTSQLERAVFSERLGIIYDIRYEIYRRKFFIKFLNNFIAQLTPFFFYSIGGYLVIQGDLTFGALVAVLAAYKDLSSPWKELLDYYQQKEDARIKYEQVAEQFGPDGMLSEAQLDGEADMPEPLSGEIAASNLSLTEDGGIKVIDGASFAFPLNETVALVGPAGGGKDELAMLLARLLLPSSGRLQVAGRDLAELPESVTGTRLAYLGPNPFLFSASLRDNLVYGLKRRPVRDARYSAPEATLRQRALAEAARAGNSALDSQADWIDYAAAAVEDSAALDRRLVNLLHAVELEGDAYRMGLRGTLDPQRRPILAARLLEARRALRARLADGELNGIVEAFDARRFNSNASVAENLLYGTPVGPTFEVENLATNPYVRRILDKAGLTGTLLEVGREVAETMVELFADLAPGHEFFEQFSFIRSEDLPEVQALLGRVARGEGLAAKPSDRAMLLTLPFKLIPARHRLGLIGPDLRSRLLEARRLFAAELPEGYRDAVAFFAEDEYNAAASLQDNILFGKIAYGEAQAAVQVGRLIAEIVETLDLRDAVIEVGLDFHVGVGGSRLSMAQRQKAALARALLRRPEVLILNDAVGAMDGAAQARIMTMVLETRRGGIVWALPRTGLARLFDRVLVVRGGQVLAQGRFGELDEDGSPLRELLEAE